MRSMFLRLINWLRPRLDVLFSVDLRTLALFRALLGAVLFADMCMRMSDVRRFYSDLGLAPRSWIADFAGNWRIDLYMANGETWFAVLLLCLEALAALALLFGWRTRLVTLLCFVLEASLLNRNQMVLIGGDILLECLLFWSLFLPLGARWSVDAALNTRAQPEGHKHLSWASAGLLLQVLSVYFFSAMLKTGREWWPDGTAVYYALQLDQYATPLGFWLRPYQSLLQGLSYFVYFLEMLGPILVLSPFYNRPLRFSVMLLLMCMHIGFLFCLKIGPFPMISLTSLTVLLGGWFWDWMDGRVQGRERRLGPAPLRIYYDRDCGFCIKMCLLFKTFLVLPRAQIAPAQDQARAKALLEANYSWVIIDHDEHAYLKWSAFAMLLRRSPLFCWLGWLLDPRSRGRWAVRPGDAVYDLVGRHRGGFGKLSAALLPYRDIGFETSRLAQGLAAMFVVLVCTWNIRTLHRLPARLDAVLSPPFHLLRIDQLWNMFAPFPSKDDGWWVFPGQFMDGTPLDVLHPERAGVSYDKPEYISETFPNIRWHKYDENLWSPQYSAARYQYGKFLCRSWNSTHPLKQNIRSFKMIFMLETSLPPGQTPTVEQHVVWQQNCYGESGQVN
jgi:vitamin K-dependent gamma-carboxylase-like protein